METKKYKNVYVKFATNIPETVTFKYDTPKEFDGQYGKQFNYAVEWKGVDAYMSTTPRLNDILQEVRVECGALQGVTLQILKYEDGTTKLWKIMDTRGNDLTPANFGAGSTPQSRQTQNSGSPQGGNPQMREWALKIVDEIKQIKARLDALEQEKADLKAIRMDVDGLVGALITPENEQAFELHKATTEPLRDANKKRNEQAVNDDIPIVSVDEAPF